MWDQFKYFGRVWAGFPSPAADYEEEDIDLKKYLQPNASSIYLARVAGDSMVNAHIPDGSLVVVDKAMRPVNNSIVIASLNGEHVIKHYVETHSGVFLAPNNSAFKSIRVTDEMEFAIWGVVTHVIIQVKK